MKSHHGWKSRKVSVIFLGLCLSLAGCSSMMPSVPADVLQRSSPVKVQSASFLLFNDGSFAVGEYDVTKINYGVVRTNGVRFGPLTRSDSAGSFSFLISGPRPGWTADCHRRAKSRGLAFNRAEVEVEKSTLQCEMRSGLQKATLEVKGMDNSRSGVFRLGADDYSVRQYFADNVELGKPYIPGPLGLRIDRDGENVGALELARPGTFWINRTLAPEVQDAVAGVLAAMEIEHRRNGL